MDSYQSDPQQGIVLLQNGASEFEISMLVGINPDPSHLDDMIDRLCQLRAVSMAASVGTAFN